MKSCRNCGAAPSRTSLPSFYAEVVRAVAENGGKGALTIKFTFSKKAKDGSIEIDMTASNKPPKDGLGTAVMFAGEDGSLSPYDPRQEALPFPRAVENGRDTARPVFDSGHVMA